jgi:hypothetical protein
LREDFVRWILIHHPFILHSSFVAHVEHIQSQKGRLKECEFSIKALDSERVRLDGLVEKKKREGLEKKLESSAYRAASEELRFVFFLIQTHSHTFT